MLFAYSFAKEKIYNNFNLFLLPFLFVCKTTVQTDDVCAKYRVYQVREYLQRFWMQMAHHWATQSAQNTIRWVRWPWAEQTFLLHVHLAGETLWFRDGQSIFAFAGATRHFLSLFSQAMDSKL